MSKPLASGTVNMHKKILFKKTGKMAFDAYMVQMDISNFLVLVWYSRQKVFFFFKLYIKNYINIFFAYALNSLVN